MPGDPTQEWSSTSHICAPSSLTLKDQDWHLEYQIGSGDLFQIRDILVQQREPDENDSVGHSKNFGALNMSGSGLNTEDAIIKKINKKIELAPKFMKCMNHAFSTH